MSKDALQKLMDRWRAKGDEMCPVIPREKLPYNGWTTQQTYERMVGGILVSCADELQAAIKSEARICIDCGTAEITDGDFDICQACEDAFHAAEEGAK